MNNNIYKDKIVFKIESIGDEIKFLDTKVSAMKDHQSKEEDQYLLILSMYSKDTDTHQYLYPESCHPEHVTRSIPTTIINRCHTNCSDRVKEEFIQRYPCAIQSLFIKIWLQKRGH